MNDGLSKFSVLIVIGLLFSVVAVSGCTGNGNSTDGAPTNGEETNDGGLSESDISSIDVTLSGFTGGQLSESVRIRARNFDAETPDMRIEGLEGDEGAVIYNNQKELGYVYEPSKEMWTEFSGTLAEDAAQGYADAALNAREWAVEHGVGNEATVSYGQDTVEVTVNSVNSGLSDDVFTPPEGADVESVAMP